MDCNPLFIGLDPNQACDVTHQLIHVCRFAFGCSLVNEIPQVADDFPATERFRCCLLHHLEQIGSPSHPGPQLAHTPRDVVRDRRERLAELVRQQRRDFTHGAQALCVRQLSLRKPPSISETLDWALALVVLGASVLSRELIVETLNILLKDKDDIARALREAGR